jgi:hypothetical protein
VAIQGKDGAAQGGPKAPPAADWIRERLRFVYGAVVAEPLPAYMTETIDAIRSLGELSGPRTEKRLEGKPESHDANHI